MRSDASVYRAKYALRRALDRVTALRALQPNAISVAVLVPSFLAALSLTQGWWAVAALAIVARMFLATLDGYVAETYGKRSRLGAYLNRAMAQIGDAVILLSLLARADALWVGIVVAATWIADVLALLGPIAGGTLQWIGPAAQADRLTILLVASVLALFLPVEWTVVLQLLAALLAVTIALRLWRSVRELAAA